MKSKEMKKLIILLFLSTMLFGDCEIYLQNADKAIKESENNIWIKKMQQKSIKSIMYMMRYKICKEKEKKEKNELQSYSMHK